MNLHLESPKGGMEDTSILQEDDFQSLAILLKC